MVSADIRSLHSSSWKQRQRSLGDLQLGQSVERAMEQQQAGTWDSVEACLECITTCSIDDGECITTCVRTHLGDEEELWTSSLCL